MSTEPVPRPTARVLVLDEEDCVLLILASDGESRGSGRPVWLTPGGGLEPGETYEEAAYRELEEEVGLRDAVLGACVWLRRLPYALSDGVAREKHERYFFCRVKRFDVEGVDEATLDMEAVGGFRWWSIAEIEASSETFAPRRLDELLGQLIRDGPPIEAFDVGL